MAQKRHRSTKEETLKAKLQRNAETRAKLQGKLKVLDETDVVLNQQLRDLTDDKKKAARAAEAKAKREEKKKKEKELMQAIKKSGMDIDEAIAKLGI